MGSHTQSIEKVLSDPGSDITLLVELNQLEDMIEVLLADYNGETHAVIGNRTPLEAMSYCVNRQPSYLRTLPRFMRSNLCLLQEARVVPIKGSVKSGVRPHINFSNVRYTNDILASYAGLIGKKLRIYYDVHDMRVIKAFFEDGSELGILTAARPWCFSRTRCVSGRELPPHTEGILCRFETATTRSKHGKNTNGGKRVPIKRRLMHWRKRSCREIFPRINRRGQKFLRNRLCQLRCLRLRIPQLSSQRLSREF